MATPGFAAGCPHLGSLVVEGAQLQGLDLEALETELGQWLQPGQTHKQILYEQLLPAMPQVGGLRLQGGAE